MLNGSMGSVQGIVRYEEAISRVKITYDDSDVFHIIYLLHTLVPRLVNSVYDSRNESVL